MAAGIAAVKLIPLGLPWHLGVLGAALWLSGRRQSTRSTLSRWFRRPLLNVPSVVAYLALTAVVVIALIVLDRLDNRWLIVQRPSVLAALGAIIVNAVAEETVWRGFFGWPLGTALAGINFVQASAFGLAHWNGVPGGLLGVASSSTFGLAMGAASKRSASLVVPILIHAVADTAIIALIMA